MTDAFVSQFPVSAEERLQCEAAVINFMTHFDCGEFEEMKHYFAPDGQWIRNNGTVINGPDEITSASLQRPSGMVVRHVLSNLRTSRLDASRLRVQSYLCVYQSATSPAAGGVPDFSGPSLVGRYTDDLRDVNGVWKIEKKSLLVDLVQRNKQ